MTTRERRLAYIILGFIVVAGAGFVGYQFYLQPMNAYARQISELEEQIGDRELDTNKIVAERKRLEPYAKISLPFTPNTQATADILRRTDVARGKYVEKLIDMLQKSGFASIVVNDKKPENKSTPQFKNLKGVVTKGKDMSIYTRLEFNVDAKGNLASLTKWMEQFYKLQLLHQIKNLTVMRPINPPQGSKPNELDIKMTIEALVLDSAEQRKTLEPTTPVNLPPVLAPDDRDYTKIAAKDLFYGPTPDRYVEAPVFVNANPHIKLTEVVTKGAAGPEARLWNAFHGQLYTILPRKAGDGFYVERFGVVNGVETSLGPSSADIKMYDDADEPKEQYSWTVIKLLDEGLVLKGSKNPRKDPKSYHLLRPGRVLSDAEPLSKSDVKRLGISEEKSTPAEPAEDPAQAKKER